MQLQLVKVSGLCILILALFVLSFLDLVQRQTAVQVVTDVQQRQQHQRSPPHQQTTTNNNGSAATITFGLSPQELHAALQSEQQQTTTRSNYCSRDQIILGEWVPHVTDTPPYVTPTQHLRCYPAEMYKSKPWHSWRWKPHDHGCKFSLWNRTSFCRVMAGATLSIVGDSLSWEQYSSLVQLNGQRTHQGYQHQSRELGMNIAQPVCNGQTRIVYRRDDRLRNLTASLEEHFPTVLVLNRGAHYTNDTEHLASIRRNLQVVQDWQRQCREVYGIKCHFFWRTSVPGHPECGTFKQPENDLALMEARVNDRSMYDNQTINYHWYHYQHQNKLTLEELKRSGVEYNIIDAYYLNMRRPDEHRSHQGDCLHNCYPGKMDVYNQLLLHYLKGSQERADIQNMKKVAEKRGWHLDETTEYDKKATELAKRIREGGAAR